MAPFISEGCQRSESGRTCNMINGYHIDSIVDIRNQTELDAALDHPPDEVVRVGNYNTPQKQTSISMIFTRLLPSATREREHMINVRNSPADSESPTTYPGRTMCPLRPCRPALNNSFSETHLLCPYPVFNVDLAPSRSSLSGTPPGELGSPDNASESWT